MKRLFSEVEELKKRVKSEELMMIQKNTIVESAKDVHLVEIKLRKVQ